MATNILLCIRQTRSHIFIGLIKIVFSQIPDVDNPDLEKISIIRAGKTIRIVLHAGESVFYALWMVAYHTRSGNIAFNGNQRIQFFELARAGELPENNSNHPKLAPLFSAYLRTIGFFKRIFN